ncbi:metallophosphoesterase family protein [Sphingomonas sp.]|uniref:metallophosphoesterase family protein n=1 Tax=Sphingomonas sp. TaxID=28214 RepID=UPI002FCB2352
MATIAHLSDVHFGHHDPQLVASIEALLADKKPDLIAISGDLTQRARVRQFRLACEFLDRLRQQGHQLLVVPGNHDVPLYDIFRRFARPLHRYRRFIGEDLCPYWENGELAVLGINTARSLTLKHGSVSREQMERIRDEFARAGDRLRVLVTHHPLLAMPLDDDNGPTRVAKRSNDALLAAAEAGVDLLLAGHFHRTFSKSARDMVDNVGPALIVQAGTATSTRLRGGEQQSFNWIEAHKDGIDLTVYAWQGEAFAPGRPARFVYDGTNWHGATARAA